MRGQYGKCQTLYFINAQVRAAALPEYKRYIDPAIIEANYRCAQYLQGMRITNTHSKREEAHAAAEAAAAKQAADAKKALVEGLAAQLAERARLLEAARAAQQEERRRIEDAVKVLHVDRMHTSQRRFYRPSGRPSSRPGPPRRLPKARCGRRCSRRAGAGLAAT